MFGFFTPRCQLCGNLLKRTVHRWKLNGRSTRVCTICNDKLERRASAAAFGQDVQIPEIKRRMSGCSIFMILAVAFILLCLMSALITGISREPESAPPDAPTKSVMDQKIAPGGNTKDESSATPPEAIVRHAMGIVNPDVAAKKYKILPPIQVKDKSGSAISAFPVAFDDSSMNLHFFRREKEDWYVFITDITQAYAVKLDPVQISQ